MAMTISIDDDLKREFSEVCGDIGLSASAAFGVFAKAVVRERRIPFELTAVSEEERRGLHVAERVARGQRDFDDGAFVSRGDYEAARARSVAVA